MATTSWCVRRREGADLGGKPPVSEPRGTSATQLGRGDDRQRGLDSMDRWVGEAELVRPQHTIVRPAADIVVILAPPRSFTTVLSAMLGQHPQLYGLPETYFLTCDSVDEWATLYRGTNHTDGALRAIAQTIFGEQTTPTVNMARQWLQARSYLSTSEVLRLLARRVAP